MTYQFSYRRYSLPFRAHVRTAHGVWTSREGLYVRLENEQGCVGFGECAPIPWFGTETVNEAESACAAFGTRVTDEQIAALPEKYSCLRFAFESARTAQRGATPLAQAPDYLPVAALLPAGRAALEKIPAFAERGFATYKWKVGAGDASDELALLDDVLGTLPAGSRLRLDANGAWTRRSAERWLSRCVDYPVEFIEQPVAADSDGAEDLLLGLAGDYPVPLALDESIVRARDVSHWLDAGWRGLFVIKPSLLGNAANALAKVQKDRVVFSSALETGLGAAAALREAFEFYSKADKPRAIGFGVWPLFDDARFDGPHGGAFIRADDFKRINPVILWNALN